MNQKVHTTVGELIQVFYAQFMELYGDEELASVATAAIINDLLSAEADEPELEVAA